MENPAVRSHVAYTNVRMQCVGDNVQRTVRKTHTVLFVSVRVLRVLMHYVHTAGTMYTQDALALSKTCLPIHEKYPEFRL